MMEEDSGTVRTIAWSQIFPWLNLFRTFRLAIAVRPLVLSALGMLLMFGGWWTIGKALYPHEQECCRLGAGTAEAQHAALAQPAQDGCPFAAVAKLVPERPFLFGPASPVVVPGPGTLVPGPAANPWALVQFGDPLISTWRTLTLPVLQLFSPNSGKRDLVAAVAMGLWGLAVWAFFGAAVTRLAAVQLACEERLSWGSLLRHVNRKWIAYFAAPLLPLIGIGMTALPIAAVSLLFHLGGLGVFVAGALWVFFLLGGLLVALLLLGLMFGWPLMWATISVEGTDSFDALSRSYAYTFQRPLQYLFYAVLAGAFGLLGWVLVAQFAAAVIWLTYWAAAWGGAGLVREIAAGNATLGFVGGSGAILLHFWVDCVKWLAVAYLFSYFWTAETAIYYLLRRSVDATEMDEVALDDQPVTELPPLKTEGQEKPPEE